MKRRIIGLLLLVMILVTSVLTVSASEGVMPRLNNTASTSTNFTISSSGKATISAVYNGYKGVTTGATVTSYLEKKTLGLFWSRVDIDEPNNAWVDTSSDYADVFAHEFQLDSKGTYRATVTYRISGSGGATDVIPYEQERTYS